MPAYQRKLKKGKMWRYAGSYEGRYYCSRSIYQTRKEALDAERQEIERIKEEIKNPRSGMTLKELCEKRLDYLSLKSRRYYSDNRRTFRKLLRHTGEISADDVSRSLVHSYLLKEAERLKASGKDQFETNAQLRYIRALFNYAIDELEVIDINPTRRLKFYGTVKRLKYIPPDRHIQMVCEWSYEHQRNLMIFALDSACRISEALRATGDDIDEDRGLLTLWTRKKRYSDLTPRRIELPDRIKGMKRKGRLFPEFSRYPRFLEKHCREIGIKPFGWHSFRHRKASLMAQERKSLTEIQHYLGHESIVVTAKYLHILGFNEY